MSKSSRRDLVKMAATGVVGATVGAVAGNYYGMQTRQGEVKVVARLFAESGCCLFLCEI